MVVAPYQIQNPYGEVRIKSILELLKLEKSHLLIICKCRSIYFNTSVIKQIKKSIIRCSNVFELLRKKNKKTSAFPIHESWQDIGIKRIFF